MQTYYNLFIINNNGKNIISNARSSVKYRLYYKVYDPYNQVSKC